MPCTLLALPLLLPRFDANSHAGSCWLAGSYRWCWRCRLLALALALPLLVPLLARLLVLALALALTMALVRTGHWLD